MSREKQRGSHVFIKHITFQLVSQNPVNTLRSIWRYPFLTALQHFRGLGTAGSIKLRSIPLHLPFFSLSFVKCSQFQEIVIQNAGEVTEFWLGRSCRCYSLRKTIMIAYVSNGCESARSQKFSYSRMYKPFSYCKKTPSRIIYYYT